MSDLVGLIVDIVRSRDLHDRERGQRAVRESFERAHRSVDAVEPLWATAGDEFQAVYRDVRDALAVTAHVRLLLPDGVDCRFGVGRGAIRVVEQSAGGHAIQDGSAWWSAREAIEIVHRRQRHGHPYLRTWFSEEDGTAADLVNAYLISRDHALSRMKPRERRMAAAFVAGHSQAEIAREEHLSQSAVSQLLQRSGATALMLGLSVLDGDDRGPSEREPAPRR